MASVLNSQEDEYIIIPNPIYDVVFRYLMEDNETATIILSTLINENIKKLHLEPITHPEKKEKPKSIPIPDPKTGDDIRLFHLDFSATIELPNGEEELVMIELQKANEPEDIFRFKRYISKNFQKKQKKEIVHPQGGSIKTIETPIRLLPVFILNFRIENEVNDLLIRTNRIKTGIFKNKQLLKQNEFIDNLSYDLIVVQLPNIHNITKEEYENDEYKGRLYVLLKLFDQKSIVKDNEHRLQLMRHFFPGFLDRVIKRLQSADIENPDLEEVMHAEDEYLQALIARDNEITYYKEQLDNTKEQLDNTKEQLDNTKEQLDNTKKQLDNEKNKNKQLQIQFAKLLKNQGISVEDIYKQTGLLIEEINKL